MTSFKSKVGDLEKQLSSAQVNKDKLNKIIAAKSKEVEDAATYKKLKKAKEIFGDALY